MIDFEESSGNVYADLGANDADEMLVKAQSATKIGEIKQDSLRPSGRGAVLLPP